MIKKNKKPNKKKTLLFTLLVILIYILLGVILELLVIRKDEYCLLYCTGLKKLPDISFWINGVLFWPLELFVFLFVDIGKLL